MFCLLIGCRATDKKVNSVQLPAYAPIVIEKHLPEIPDLLSRLDVEGIVKLSALVDESGNVVDVKVLQSISILDSICIEAAKKWKFNPGKFADELGNYQSAKFWVQISFDWKSGREYIVKYY
jgi:TonB family protein